MIKPLESFIRIRVSILLPREDGRLLFVRHLKDGRRYWLLPGGGQNHGESLEQAAHRELEEELCVKAVGFRFLALRESIAPDGDRHIQFPLFVAIDPDFSRLAVGDDPRVEGFDWFGIEELRDEQDKTVFPNFSDDLIAFMRGEPLLPYRTLPWIP